MSFQLRCRGNAELSHSVCAHGIHNHLLETLGPKGAWVGLGSKLKVIRIRVELVWRLNSAWSQMSDLLKLGLLRTQWILVSTSLFSIVAISSIKFILNSVWGSLPLSSCLRTRIRCQSILLESIDRVCSSKRSLVTIKHHRRFVWSNLSIELLFVCYEVKLWLAWSTSDHCWLSRLEWTWWQMEVLLFLMNYLHVRLTLLGLLPT